MNFGVRMWNVYVQFFQHPVGARVTRRRRWRRRSVATHRKSVEMVVSHDGDSRRDYFLLAKEKASSADNRANRTEAQRDEQNGDRSLTFALQAHVNAGWRLTFHAGAKRNEHARSRTARTARAYTRKKENKETTDRCLHFYCIKESWLTP